MTVDTDNGARRSPIWLWAAAIAFAVYAAYATFAMVSTGHQLRDVQAKRQEAIKQLEEAGAAADSLRRQIEETKSAQAAAESARQKIEGDVRAASTHMAELQKRTESLETELQQQRDALSAAGADKAVAEGKAGQLQTELGNAKARVRDLEQQLAAAVTEADKLRVQAQQSNPAPSP
jgi:chromosome segregation ATPase